jgi:hypothetical protein
VKRIVSLNHHVISLLSNHFPHYSAIAQPSAAIPHQTVYAFFLSLAGRLLCSRFAGEIPVFLRNISGAIMFKTSSPERSNQPLKRRICCMPRPQILQQPVSLARHTPTWRSVFMLAVFFGSVLFSISAQAQVAMLLEEPYGEFGSLNPTGHAAVYLTRVCADSPMHLRRCRPGELGSVISRYHKLAGYDWLAIPLVPYLYAVDSLDQVPAKIDKRSEDQLRDAWRRKHLESIFPDLPVPPQPPAGSVVQTSYDVSKPETSDSAETIQPGLWYMLIGAAYDRKLYGFQLDSTPAQDDAFIADWNDRRNHSHFNLLFHNCADFARVVLNFYYPHAVHRNWIADTGMTTPKQVGKSMLRYGQRHPELHPSVYEIPQVPGSLRRSQKVDGVAESVVKSKKYVVPLAIINPIFAGGLAVAWATEGRFTPPKEVPELTVIEDPNRNAGRTPLPLKPAPATAAPATTPAPNSAAQAANRTTGATQ